MSIPPDEISTAQEFEALLDYLKQNRGFDFTGYKRSNLQRWVAKRMQSLRLERYSDYVDYLEVHPEEFATLFNTLLINVTAFFRDTLAWEYLSAAVIPALLAEKKPQDPVRIWSAGCSSGEEAYTLAIVLAEALGLEEFRQRVKIYATDVDADALVQARQASYSAKDLQQVPAELHSKYFAEAGNRYVFRPDLRRTVIFGLHDLAHDAPMSRLDLLVCRNTLMYFNAETQVRILARFHFALNDTGRLFLGKAETLLTHANLFTPLCLKHRIFTKVPKLTLRDRLLIVGQAGNLEFGNHLVGHVRLREAAFDAAPVAQVVLDLQGHLLLINKEAREAFHILSQDVGRPFCELDLFHRPVELRTCIEQVYTERRAQHLTNVGRSLAEGRMQSLDVHLVPLLDYDNTPLGVNITFHDVTHYRQLQAEVEKHRQALETASEELQSTNAELETTNEELQSTVAELETTNEELHAANEELETMNEELQSGNEELRERTDELNQAKAFLESILNSLHTAAVVVGPHFNILVWNKEANELWGLRQDEVQGQSLLSLDIGLPAAELRNLVRSVLHGGGGSEYQEIMLEATNRRGRPIQCRITCNPLVGMGEDIQGVILLMEEWREHV